ncbi:hypothetical protein AMS68_000177 [Peltaster fructicola]|uniref:histidine kinase n=1 Tax=Peltaster fructicola TaxID=286661 RepID=A0A6H0XJF8_9PEZI|nr:hypothetical protein AMS68_000177 [Peltaster fructicola]
MFLPNSDLVIRLQSAELKTTGPIFDKLSSTPLSLYDPRHPPPVQKPADFRDDEYLHPTLTANERLRLTMMWYYTRDLFNDGALITRMQKKIDLLKSVLGWEFVICGVLDNDVYKRVVVSGLPIAILPRRECTCAHTVQLDDVLYLPDMLADWRFAASPHVAHGGLRSYAGTQLRCHVDDQTTIVLGSLCVASNSKEELQAAQIEILKEFADMLASDIVEGCQRRRAAQQRKNETLLDAAHTQSDIVDLLHKTYSDTKVEITEHRNSWEDTDTIEQLIKSQNHTKLPSSTDDVTQIFDDLDVQFVQSCARKIKSVLQEEELQIALQGRTQFMRGITHQLRTPLHGILGSVTLLLDESVSEGLQMIRDSGLELMSTINNMIKLNDCIEITAPAALAYADLNKLEQDVLGDTAWLPSAQSSGVLIFFDNQLADLGIGLNLSCIRDCLQLLLVNALQNTTRGSVNISIRTEDYSSIICDVKDTGCGISPQDQERIFRAYEKVDTHSSGAGLGLTLACKIAAALNGDVKLISSSEAGSHFCAEFRNPVFSCRLAKSIPLPAQRYSITGSASTIETFTNFLHAHGWQETKDANIVLVPYTSALETYESTLTMASNAPITISLVPTHLDTSTKAKYPRCMFFTGPFTTARMKEIVHATSDVVSKKNCAAKDPQDTASRVPQCLLVDDNSINLRVLSSFCDKRGFPYSTAMNGFEAFEEYTAATVPIDLILLDLQMPGRDGIEACKDIRAYEKDKALRPALVFIVTGQDSLLDRRNAAEAGADRFFVKPLALKSLEQAILEANFVRMNI